MEERGMRGLEKKEKEGGRRNEELSVTEIVALAD